MLYIDTWVNRGPKICSVKSVKPANKVQLESPIALIEGKFDIVLLAQIERRYWLGNVESIVRQFEAHSIPNLLKAANLGFGRVFSLAKPEAASLTVATVDSLIASTSIILVPKFGVVSGDARTPERKSEALDAVKNKILYIFLIVIIGSILLALVAVEKFGRHLHELSHKTQAVAAVASSIAEETFGAVHMVRSFAQEEYEVSRYSEKVDEMLKLGLKQAKVIGFYLWRS
ncbi:ABC transporter B family member 27 [Abeliophyllum distichum]|uniref:ABC transporter B family member 27 n=1 Tax=Abeliophyllum distichum TaxID=126358 RepID=A0ABD1PDP8_9LAMI